MSVLVEVDEKIILEIDALAQDSQKSRTDCLNEILRKALRRETIEEKIRRHEESYRLLPQQCEEYEIWEEVQDWEDK